MAEPRGALRPAVERGYEPSDVSVRGVLWIALILLASLALSALLLGGLLGLFEAARPPPEGSALERMKLVPPPPRLEARPLETLEQVRARERELLEGYGWIDREAGIVRIPIDRAMAILAERGWPAADESPQLPSGDADETFRPGARSPMVEEQRGN